MFIVDGSPSLLKSRARIARYFRCSGIELANLPVPEEGVSAERNRLFSSHVQECAVRCLLYLDDYHQFETILSILCWHFSDTHVH